jgi:hypothetical protein
MVYRYKISFPKKKNLEKHIKKNGEKPSEKLSLLGTTMYHFTIARWHIIKHKSAKHFPALAGYSLDQ